MKKPRTKGLARPERCVDRQLCYTDVRSRIRTGDVLLFQGKSLLSRIIQWGSKSVYSHAGFAAWWDDRLMVFQASGRGAEVLPVSSAVDAYDGQVDWYAVSDPWRAHLDEDVMLTRAVNLLGRAYATRGLIELAFRMAIGRFRDIPDPKAAPNEVFCSQYVSFCYREAGLDLVPGTNDPCTSPADLANSPYLSLQGVLRANPDDKQRRAELPGRARRPRKLGM